MITLADLFKTSLETTHTITESVFDSTIEELSTRIEEAQEQSEGEKEKPEDKVKTDLSNVSANEPSLQDKAVETLPDAASNGTPWDEFSDEKAKLDMPAVVSSLKDACLSALDIGLDQVLGEAWSGWEELKVLGDPEQTPPEDIHIVPLARRLSENRLQEF